MGAHPKRSCKRGLSPDQAMPRPTPRPLSDAPRSHERMGEAELRPEQLGVSSHQVAGCSAAHGNGCEHAGRNPHLGDAAVSTPRCAPWELLTSALLPGSWRRDGVGMAAEKGSRWSTGRRRGCSLRALQGGAAARLAVC